MRRRAKAGVHGSTRRAGGDGGGGRSDLTRLAGRNKLATRALVPSVPLAIGARSLSLAHRLRFYRADQLLLPPTQTDRSPLPRISLSLVYSWSFDFTVARRISHGKAIPKLFPGYFSVSTNTMYVRARLTGAYMRDDDVRTSNWRDFSDRPLCFRLSRWSNNCYCRRHIRRSLFLKLRFCVRQFATSISTSEIIKS